MNPKRRVLVVVLAVLVLVGAVIAGRAVWERATRTPLESALRVVDAKALRVNFTDWKQIRAAVHARPSEDPSAWIERAYDRDLTAVSSIDESADALRDHFGFSPENADWEVFSQGRDGAATVLHVGGADFDAIAALLKKAGFEKPAKADQVWKGGMDLIPKIDSTLTPEVQYVALLADQQMVVTSDTREYAAQVSSVVRGDRESLASMASLAGQVGSPEAAVLWAGDFACEDLSMSTASEEDQQEARQLIAAAGETTPVTGVLIAYGKGVLSVAEQFPDPDQAETNLRSRAKLAVGPAVGRTDGSFADELKLTSSTASGNTMMLRFKPRDPGAFPMSRISDGALVFASC